MIKGLANIVNFAKNLSSPNKKAKRLKATKKKCVKRNLGMRY